MEPALPVEGDIPMGRLPSQLRDGLAVEGNTESHERASHVVFLLKARDSLSKFGAFRISRSFPRKKLATWCLYGKSGDKHV